MSCLPPKARLPRALSLAACALSLASHITQAQQEAPIEEVRVWGTAVYASSIDLDEQAIEIKQADHISDLLRSIPGVDVGGAHSLNQRITIRSMDDKDLQILIDGARQNTYMYHHMGNLQIHADILQSVDIQVGTNSVINSGLGGSVRFETKSAEQLLLNDQNHGARVQLGAGTNSDQSVSLIGYGKLNEEFSYLLYVNDIDRKNYEVGGGRILDSEGNEVGNSQGEVVGLEGDLRDIMAKVGWQISDVQQIKLGYEHYTDEGDYSYRPDMGLATDIAISNSLGLPLTFPTEFTRDTLTLNYDLSWGDNSLLKAAIFNNQSTLWRDESAIQAIWPTDPALVEGEANNQGVNALAESTIELGVENTFSYGFDYVEYETHYANEGIELAGEQSENLAIFVQDRIQLGNVALIPGLRYSSFDVDSSVVNDSFSKITGALAAEWEASESLLLKLSTTQLFKAPDLNEVFIGAGLGVTPNADIEAEEGTNSELSLAWSDSTLGADNVSAGFTFFKTNIENHIYQYATPPADVGGRYWYDNVGDLEIDGYEVYFDYQLGGFNALLTVSESEGILAANAENSDLDGAHDSREQGRTTTLALEYAFSEEDVVVHWGVQHVGSVPHYDVTLDAATVDNSKDSFTVHNISAQWQQQDGEGFSLTFGVDNVFDEYYASHSSRNGTSFHPRFGALYLLDYEPGRNVKATLAYRF